MELARRKINLEVAVLLPYIRRMATDNLKRMEIKIPSSVIERLDIMARKKKWSRKKYVEELLKEHTRTRKTVLVFGNEEIDLK